jgi:hypothetical protein
MKTKVGVCCLALAILLNGCGMMFLGTQDYVDFKSKPAGATVLIDGVDMGKTPIELELQTNKSYIVILKKDGYEDAIYSITSHTSVMVVVLDVLFWPALIIDAVEQSWYYLEETEIDAKLEVKKIN